MSPPATLVLVHGAWHGAWCWEKVLPRLEAAGVEAKAVDLAGAGGVPGDLGADAGAVRVVLDGIGGPAVLCGHSYGGVVITEVGLHPAVVHLVYVAAFVPDAGKGLRDIPRPDPATARLPAVLGEDGLLRLEPEAVHLVYHDCDPDEVDAARARFRPQRPEGFVQEQEFVDAHAALIAELAAFIAADPAPELCRGDFLLRESDFDQVVPLDPLFGLAMRADRANQPLRQHGLDRRGHQEGDRKSVV